MTIQTFYLNHIWPLHRRFAKLAVRCKRCIMSEKATSIDEDGICLECRSSENDHVVKAPPPAAETDVGSGTVGILLSGGKDSCYLMSKWRQNHPNTPIVAIFIDNGFSSKQAVINCHDICERLSVDLIIVRSHINRLGRGIKESLLRMKAMNGNSYEVVDHTDGSEIFRIGQSVAKVINAKVLLTGISREQAVRQNGSALIVNQHGTMYSPLVEWNPTDKKILEYLYYRHGMKARRFDPSLTNHLLIPVMCAIDVKRHGYCSFEKEFAARIRRGEADRTKWLHTFEFLEWATNKGFMDGQIARELNKLNLTPADIFSEI